MAQLSAFKFVNTEADSLLSYKSIKQFRDSVLQANMGYLDSINSLLTDTNGISAIDLSNASAFLLAIKQPNKIEKDLKDVYSILVDMDVNESDLPDTKQAKTLRVIANKCPYNYGPAVWIARALLSEVDTNVVYSNNCEDLEQGNKGHRSVRNELNDTLPLAKVYPNPANSLLNVEVQLLPNETALMCLYNVEGQKVICQDLTQKFTTLSIADLSPGIYLYRITDVSGKLIGADKVVIIR